MGPDYNAVKKKKEKIGKELNFEAVWWYLLWCQKYLFVD